MCDKSRNHWLPDKLETPSAPPLSALYESYTTFHADSDSGCNLNLCSSNQQSTTRHNDQANVDVTPPRFAVDDEQEPTAPPLELMDKVPGYESASFEAVDIPPPLVPVPLKSEEESHRPPLPSIPHLSEKEVRNALLKEVSSHCCYGTRAVRDMAVTEIKHSIAFHYTLETFTEKRTTCWAYEPYTGGNIDDKNIGEVPFPWDIRASPPEYFKNHAVHLEVPHTASIKTCHVCGGVGRKRCSTCSGSGWEYCFSCHGDGHKPSALESENGRCIHCHGTGRRKCWKCNGDGMACCKGCSGTGQIKCFVRLSVTWTNHLDDHVVESVSALNADRIRSVTGEIVCKEEDVALLPLTHFPDTTVGMASAQLLQQHSSMLTSEKVLKQRHRVSIVPVAAVSYKWKNHDRMFHVYGYDQKVHAPDYPQKCCCCCCVIL